jgi:hypothetical protein
MKKFGIIAAIMTAGGLSTLIILRLRRGRKKLEALTTGRIEHCVERATHYRDQVLQEIRKHPTADTSDRSVVATALIKMAAGDCRGIISEIQSGNPGPAFKLFRLLYEDVVNGLWAQAFASDDIITALLHTNHGQLPGKMWERAAKLDTVFVLPPTAGDEDKLFVDLQSKFWKTANSYTHGGSMAINRELAGYDEESTYEILRSGTTIFILFIDAMYRLHHKKPNHVLSAIAATYFAEKW